MPAAPPPSVYDNMAAMPNVGGAPKPPSPGGAAGGLDPKAQAELNAAYKAIDQTLDKMIEKAPSLREGLQGVKMTLKGVMEGGDQGPKPPEPKSPADNQSPQEPTPPPPGNASPQEANVPA